MKITGILCLTLNVLLMPNEFSIKGSQGGNVIKFNNETLDMMKGGVVTYDKSRTTKEDKEIIFKVTDGNAKGPLRKIDVEYDFELSGFLVQKFPNNDDNQLSIEAMVCKATKKDTTNHIGYEVANNYWIFFPLSDGDFQEDKDNFVVRFETFSASVYNYDANDSEIKDTPATIGVDTTSGSRSNLTELKIDEKNYQTRISKKTFFLQIPKSGFDSYHIQKFELELANNLPAKKIEDDNTDFITENIVKYLSSHETIENRLLTMLFKDKLGNDQLISALIKKILDGIPSQNNQSGNTTVDVQDNNEDSQEKNGFKSILSLMLCFQAVLSSILIFF